MDDVVEQGRPDRRGPPRWLRRAALAVAVVAAVLVVTRPHLPSAGEPAAAPSAAPTAPRIRATAPLATGGNTSEGISIVVRQGDHLERYEAGSGRRPLARLPRGLPASAPFVHSARADGSGPLVGVAAGQLIRTSPVRGRSVTRLGRAERVLAVSRHRGRLIVLRPATADRGPRVVEVDAGSGHVTDGRPFTGFDGTGRWQAVDVVSLSRGNAVLLARAAKRRGALDLALAWDRATARATGATEPVRIGATRRLLGVAGSQLITVDDRPDGCLFRGCPVTVLSVTDRDVLARQIGPPPGWRFETTVVGGAQGGPIMVVSAMTDPGRFALVRLSGDTGQGLLVAGTAGLVGSVTPVAGPEGSVLFAMPRPEGVRLSVLLPGARSAALLLDLPALEPGAELVCACR